MRIVALLSPWDVYEISTWMNYKLATSVPLLLSISLYDIGGGYNKQWRMIVVDSSSIRSPMTQRLHTSKVNNEQNRVMLLVKHFH